MRNNKNNKSLPHTYEDDVLCQMELPFGQGDSGLIQALDVKPATAVFHGSSVCESHLSLRVMGTVHQFRRPFTARANASSVDALERILDFARTLPGR